VLRFVAQWRVHCTRLRTELKLNCHRTSSTNPQVAFVARRRTVSVRHGNYPQAAAAAGVADGLTLAVCWWRIVGDANEDGDCRLTGRISASLARCVGQQCTRSRLSRSVATNNHSSCFMCCCLCATSHILVGRWSSVLSKPTVWTLPLQFGTIYRWHSKSATAIPASNHNFVTVFIPPLKLAIWIRLLLLLLSFIMMW